MSSLLNRGLPMNKINYLMESELSNNEMIKPNSIILGNSLNIIKQLPSKSINAIITDPPLLYFEK